MVKRFVPDRGDVIWLQFSPQAGREQSGRRPAVVISPASYNGRVGLAICCPVTSQAKGYPFEVALPPDGAVGGVVLTDQVKSVDWRSRNATFIFSLPAVTVQHILARLLTLIEPTPATGS